jgi:hypothetical protein
MASRKCPGEPQTSRHRVSAVIISGVRSASRPSAAARDHGRVSDRYCAVTPPTGRHGSISLRKTDPGVSWPCPLSDQGCRLLSRRRWCGADFVERTRRPARSKAPMISRIDDDGLVLRGEFRASASAGGPLSSLDGDDRSRAVLTTLPAGPLDWAAGDDGPSPDGMMLPV